MSNLEIDSPFQPGKPVNPEKFKGREEIINDIIKYFPSITSGNSKHFFITGKRGMGKTSLANLILNHANNHSMVTAHIMNDGVHTTEELIIQIFERIFNSIRSESWSKKILDSFKDHIEYVGVGGVSIKFNPTEKELKNIKDNFAFYLIDLLNNFKNKKGIFIVIDDINGLTETSEFANWYKSFADTLETTFQSECNIGLMLTGYPEKWNKLYEQNPSFNRLFNYHSLDELKYNETNNFYEDIFNSIKIKWDKNALNVLMKY